MQALESRTRPSPCFLDRRDAGKKLAALLEPYRNSHPLILALPRGGVAVAAEVALELDAPLEIFVARKIGAPGHPELAMGAIAAGGTCLVDAGTTRALGVTHEEFDLIAAAERRELQRRMERYGVIWPPEGLGDRPVILIDDGLATGLTARASVRALRQQGVRHLVLAVPVSSEEAAEGLRAEVDELVCLSTPVFFGGVGMWYADFDQVSDEEVISQLEDARARQRPADGHAAGPVAAPASVSRPSARVERSVTVEAGGVALAGGLVLPAGANGLVLFAHGSGSGRHSPRNRYVADVLNRAGLGTLLLDLLTPAEERADAITRELRFDIGLLAERLVGAVDWLARDPDTRDLRVGCFGASTGAAAALIAAAQRPESVAAVVSRGGRPDLAGEFLGLVNAPTLLIVGGADTPVIALNEDALRRLGSKRKKLVLVPEATHLFEEPGALEEVARLAAAWFTDAMPSSRG